MKRIEVKLTLAVVAPLLDIIKGVADALDKRLMVSLSDLTLDDDMKDVWQGDLLATQTDGIHTLLSLFDSHFFATGAIVLDGSNAEPILRACSAVRLYLRENNLKSLDDESLETGEVDIDRLPETLQKAFMCYVFLATLQELIIQHLDSSILEGS